LLAHKHDSAGSLLLKANQLNRVYMWVGYYAKLYWSTCPVLFRPDTGHHGPNRCDSAKVTKPAAKLTKPTAKVTKIVGKVIRPAPKLPGKKKESKNHPIITRHDEC
jgi:hypothetical protein